MPSDALLIIDMQAGMLQSDRPPRDVEEVVRRINSVADAVREAGGLVVFIQHRGAPEDDFAENAPGWPILPSLERMDDDHVVSKTTCDSFYHTELDSLLKRHHVDRLFVCGWATDFCVDTTVRAAVSRDCNVTVIGDAHTAADRPHLDAASIIRHHNLTWQDLLTPPDRSIEVVDSSDALRQLGQEA